MSNENLTPKSMDDVLTEQEVLDLFGIERSGLDRIRHKDKLPFCKVSHRNRIYFVEDVMEFLKRKRTVLNRGSDETKQG